MGTLREIAVLDRSPNSNPDAHVDETCMQTIGIDFDNVLEQLVLAVVALGEEAAKLLLTLSPRVVVTASSQKLALLLQPELGPHGMASKVHQRVRDAGLPHTSASSKISSFFKTGLITGIAE